MCVSFTWNLCDGWLSAVSVVALVAPGFDWLLQVRLQTQNTKRRMCICVGSANVVPPHEIFLRLRWVIRPKELDRWTNN